jgi:chromosome segregation ATPase
VSKVENFHQEMAALGNELQDIFREVDGFCHEVETLHTRLEDFAQSQARLEQKLNRIQWMLGIILGLGLVTVIKLFLV